MEYRSYIASQKWRASPARLVELAEARNRCRICFGHGAETGPIEVHHATYARLGDEAQGDLLALCRSCHAGVTNFLRQRRYERSSPRRADVPQVRDTRLFFTDPTRK
jgi:hypothetical protein